MKQEQKTHVSADALIQLLKGAKSIRWQLALGVVMSLVLVVCALVIPTQMGASFKMARAMHSRCFCPPERFLPDCLNIWWKYVSDRPAIFADSQMETGMNAITASESCQFCRNITTAMARICRKPPVMVSSTVCREPPMRDTSSVMRERMSPTGV